MSGDRKDTLARRPVLKALAALIGVATAGGAAYELGVFGPSWPASPYDDLLAGLADRRDAVTVGRAALAQHKALTAKDAAAVLRRHSSRSLREQAQTDIRDNALTEVDGWVMPTSLVQISALAATAA